MALPVDPVLVFASDIQAFVVIVLGMMVAVSRIVVEVASVEPVQDIVA